MNAQQFVQTLINPPRELAGLTLSSLLAPSEPSERPIPRYGPGRFSNTLKHLHRRGHRWADPKIRLRQLNLYQRQLLLAAVFATAPNAWREAGK